VPVDVSVSAPDLPNAERERTVTFIFQEIDPVIARVRLTTSEL